MDFWGTQEFGNTDSSIKNLVVHRGDSFPLAAKLGQLFFRMDTDTLHVLVDESSQMWYDLTNKYPVQLGTVALWKGTLGTIPTGWQLCDGTNGTLDLRGKFIKTCGPLEAVGVSGGSNTTHTHTASSHAHVIISMTSGPDVTGGSDTGVGGALPSPGQAVSGNPPHYHNFIKADSSLYLTNVSNPTTVDTSPNYSIPTHVTAAYIMRMS